MQGYSVTVIEVIGYSSSSSSTVVGVVLVVVVRVVLGDPYSIHLDS